MATRGVFFNEIWFYRSRGRDIYKWYIATCMHTKYSFELVITHKRKSNWVLKINRVIRNVHDMCVLYVHIASHT